jgi:hypothetical protein
VQTLQVELDPHHLQRLGATAPLTGIIELVWNALDADAENVTIGFARNELEGISEIHVIDDGHGMTEAEAVAGFKSLGGSWKPTAGVSKSKGRGLHGRDGRGRFRAAGVGRRIRWQTVACYREQGGQRLAIEIEMRLADLIHCKVSDATPTDAGTGTVVIIDDFPEAPPGLGGDGPIEKLTGTFGLYLQTWNAHLTFDRQEIDPVGLQDHRADYEIELHDEARALLTVIEWKRRVDRALYLCDERGTPLADQPPGIQAPGFEFTGYLQWDGFASDTELAVADLGYGVTKRLLDAARDRLREHFKVRLEERTREQIEAWKEEKVYPWDDSPSGTAEQAARDVFDVVAVTASGAVNASERPGRRLSLRLLREALEQDPGALHRVLREVLDLPEDRLYELSDLLERTPLTALIATSREIADRLEFLRGLEELVLGDKSRHVRERSQLHRILAGKTWVFGEEYALAADDNSGARAARPANADPPARPPAWGAALAAGPAAVAPQSDGRDRRCARACGTGSRVGAHCWRGESAACGARRGGQRRSGGTNRSESSRGSDSARRGAISAHHRCRLNLGSRRRRRHRFADRSGQRCPGRSDPGRRRPNKHRDRRRVNLGREHGRRDGPPDRPDDGDRHPDDPARRSKPRRTRVRWRTPLGRGLVNPGAVRARPGDRSGATHDRTRR